METIKPQELLEYINELKILVGCLISEQEERLWRLAKNPPAWKEQALAQLDKCRDIDTKLGIDDLTQI